MSAAKKLGLVLAVTVIAIGLWSGRSTAQGSPGNPSGGTKISQPREVSGPSMLPTDYLSRSIVLDFRLAGFQLWASTQISLAATSPAVIERRAFVFAQRKARVR